MHYHRLAFTPKHIDDSSDERGGEWRHRKERGAGVGRVEGGRVMGEAGGEAGREVQRG